MHKDRHLSYASVRIYKPQKNLFTAFPCLVLIFETLQMIHIVAMHLPWKNLSPSSKQTLLFVKNERNGGVVYLFYGFQEQPHKTYPVVLVFNGSNCI